MPKLSKKATKTLDKAEPSFVLGQPVERSDIIRALNWYSQNAQINKSRKWVWEWMKLDGTFTEEEIQQLKAAKFSRNLTQTLASSCRLLARGLEDDDIRTQVRDTIRDIIHQFVLETARPDNDLLEREEFSESNKVIASIDEQLDRFYDSNYTRKFDGTRVEPCSDREGWEALVYYRELRKEITHAREGYDHLCVKSKLAYRQFLESIEKYLNTIVSTKHLTETTIKASPKRRGKKKR